MSRQDRAEATRRLVLEAAAQVFTEVGYSGANVNEIVARAQVTKGALYFHFESKAFLARALIEERDRILGAAVGPITESKMPALEKLIHGTIVVARLAITDVYFRAGDQLLFEVGDFQSGPDSTIERSLLATTSRVSLAIEEGDLVASDPYQIARLMTMQFVGARVLSRKVTGGIELFTCLGDLWKMLINTFAADHVRSYFQQLVERMIAAQIDALDSPTGPVGVAR